MDLDEARDRLYAGSPEAFVATRKELVAQARAAKDRELARQVGALRRPTAAAWLVNQLARGAAEPLSELLALGPELAAMHVSGDATQLRTLALARRQAVDALVRRAVALGAAQGRPASDQVRQQVATTLEAALAHHAVAERLLQGALVAAPESAAAFPLELFETDGGSRRPAPVVEPPGASVGDAGLAPDEDSTIAEEQPVAEVVDLQQAAARREQQARERRLHQQLGHAQAELEQAARRSEVARRAVEQAAASLHEAERLEKQATGQRDDLRRQRDDVAARLAELEQQLEQAHAQAEQATTAGAAARQALAGVEQRADEQQQLAQQAERRVDELTRALQELAGADDPGRDGAE